MASSFNPDGGEEGAEQATESENPGGEVLAGGPPGKEVNDEIYYRESHKYTGYDRRRTDLRTLDDHSSWRSVARACHCEPGR